MNEILIEKHASNLIDFMTSVTNLEPVNNVYSFDIQEMGIKRFSVVTKYDQAQVETATVIGTITTAGNASVVVTSAGMTGSPKTITVPVLLGNDASAIALAIRTALAADEAVSGKFIVSGTTDKVILTAKVPALNDATLNIAISDGTCVGITTSASSADTAGSAIGKNIVFINPPETRGELVVEIVYNANPDITWPESVVWQSTEPTFVVGKIYKLEFFTRDGGTTWYGNSIGGW